MSAEKLSIRYSKALFDEALSQGLLDVVFADLEVLNAAVQSSKELKAMFKSPIVKGHKKASIVHEIFSGKVNATTEKFLDLLILQSREGYLQDIIRAFFKQYNEMKGISEVTVTTATELDAANEQKIADFIKTQSGYPNVKINKKTDAAIIGGFIVDFGGKLFDNSVRYKLSKIEKELAG